MITDIEGVLVGHGTDRDAMTGCTVVVLPPATVASGEIRGGAPASREFALLEPTRTVGHVDAVVLSGGSAFGLAAADGVMDRLAERGRGFQTPHGAVPIVVGLSLFDLGVGDGSVRPGPAEGRAAFDAAGSGRHDIGTVGAGTGATCNKWSGSPQPAGIGAATVTADSVIVSALIAVNAFGAIDDGTAPDDPGPPVRPEPAGTNTTIGLVVTNAVVDKAGCHRLAQGAHDGLARALQPAHTAIDGDAVVMAATGQAGVEADPMHLRVLVQAATVRAIRSVAPAH
ncbi:MAG: P1 family peptidase [Actinomycetota bacterium]